MAVPALTRRLRGRAAVREFALAGGWIALAVWAGVFYVAYDDGSYDIAARSTIAIGVWWTILLAVAVGVWRLERLLRLALLPTALLAAFACWTLASAAWSASVEAPFTEFNRVALYLGLFVLAVLAVGSHAGRWLQGLALAVASIAVVALVSRLFPGSFPARGLPTFLPDSIGRLSFPLDYWNGLGSFLALGVPLVLGRALASDRIERALWVGVLPIFGVAVYLTSSRGAVAAGIVGIAVLLAAVERRWSAAGALLAAGAGTVAAVVVVARRDALSNGPFGSPTAAAEGRTAAVLIVLICLATAAAQLAGSHAVRRLPVPPRGLRLGVVAALATFLVAGIALSHPVRRFHEFEQRPASFQTTNFVQTHLLSGNGSGRWQFWAASVDQFTHAPLYGQGAGSYESWWLQHGSFYYSLKDAHSLYLETLGELGIVGLLLLVGFLAACLAAVPRVLRARSPQRTVLVALLAAAAAWMVAAGLDWMWEMTAVTCVGVLVLGLVCGSDAGGGRPALVRDESRRRARGRLGLGLGLAVGVVTWLLVCTEAISLLTALEVRKSQAAVRAGDAHLALSRARAAAEIEPWAATPYLQLALVEQAVGDLGAAEHSIRSALQRDTRDWRLWVVAARIETARGGRIEAEASLRRARTLNPRSPSLTATP